MRKSICELLPLQSFYPRTLRYYLRLLSLQSNPRRRRPPWTRLSLLRPLDQALLPSDPRSSVFRLVLEARSPLPSQTSPLVYQVHQRPNRARPPRVSAHRPQEPALQGFYPQCRPVDLLPSRARWKRKAIQGSRFTLVIEVFSLLSTHQPLHWGGGKGSKKRWGLSDVCTLVYPNWIKIWIFWTSTLTYSPCSMFYRISISNLAGWRGSYLLSKGSNQLRFVDP